MEALLISALTAGAKAIADSVLGKAGEDLYDQLKSRLLAKNPKLPMAQLEASPQSVTAADAIKSQITSAITADPDLEVLAKKLLLLMQKENPALLSQLNIRIDGNSNTVALPGGVAVGPHASVQNLYMDRSLVDRLANFTPNSPNALLSSSTARHPPFAILLIAIGTVFVAIMSFILWGALPDFGWGAAPGFFPLAVGIVMIYKGVAKLRSFSRSPTMVQPAGVVATNGSSQVTLVLQNGDRMIVDAIAPLAQMLGPNDIGIAHIRDKVLTEFRR